MHPHIPSDKKTSKLQFLKNITTNSFLLLGTSQLTCQCLELMSNNSNKKTLGDFFASIISVDDMKPGLSNKYQKLEHIDT